MHGGRVELLETLELARLHCVLQCSEGRELDEFATRPAHIDLLELVGGKSLGSLDLWDDLVTAALYLEAVHVVAADESGQVSTDLLEVQPERSTLSRSKTISVCGWSYLRSVSANMKSPL